MVVNKNKPLISVIMTTYNVEKYVKKAINSILNQTYTKFELIIVDDNSNDNTINIIREYNDPRIKLFKNNINAGTYFCKNYGVSISKGDFIAIQDSDDYSNPTRLEKQYNHYLINPNAVIIKCQYVRVDENHKILTEPKAAFQASLIRKEVFLEMGYYDSVRVAGDDEFDCRAKLYYGREKVIILPELLYYNLHREGSLTTTIKIGGDERMFYVEEFKSWHEKNKDNKHNLHVPYPLEIRHFKVHPNIKVNNNKIDKERFIKIKTKANFITANVVSIKRRENSFKLVVNDILPQVDLLRVYLNDYDNVPKFLINDKIQVFLAKDNCGDIADNGKFFKCSEVDGYYFTIDDDIKYPKDYVNILIDSIEKYNYEAVVGVHGVNIKYETFKHYYDRDSREVKVFWRKNAEDSVVHILGTGTVAYHTSILRINFYEINYPFMVDVFFAIQANRNNVPLVCIERENEWMKEYEVQEDTKIYSNFRNDDAIQTKLVLENIFNDSNNLQNNDPEIETKLLYQSYINNKQIYEIENLKNQVQTKEDGLAWYARTYDHLPKWYLKIGGIFRRL